MLRILRCSRCMGGDVEELGTSFLGLKLAHGLGISRPSFDPLFS